MNNSSACTIILVLWNTLQVSLNVLFKLIIHVLFDLYCKCRYFLVVASLRNYVCICRLVVIDVYTSVQIQKDVNLSNPSVVYKFLQFQCGIEVADECHQSLVTFICNLNSTGTKLNVSQTLITAIIDSRLLEPSLTRTSH